MQTLQPSDSETLNLTLEAYQLSFRTSYDQLICLPTLKNIQSLWYQEETARKVMKDFRGRTILADEVGLGKTIEAGLILKEYISAWPGPFGPYPYPQLTGQPMAGRIKRKI